MTNTDWIDEILESVFAFAADKNGSDDYRSRGKIDIPEAKAAIQAKLAEAELGARLDELNLFYKNTETYVRQALGYPDIFKRGAELQRLKALDSGRETV